MGNNMRIISFRGMGISDNKWHYGMFGIKETSVPCCEAGYYIISRANMLTAIKVHPESVGQFTGLSDSNRNKIYEGDIIRDKDGEVYEIDWSVTYNSAYYAAHLNGSRWTETQMDLFDLEEIVVVGNAYDNRDLLCGREWDENLRD
jgi:uncharacterized phage protein (TIGR01671 family)